MLRIARKIRHRWRLWRRGPGRLEPESDSFGNLFPDGTQIERVATGFNFTEGPVWIGDHRALFFSDIPASRIMKLGPDGSVTTVRHPSNKSNGLTRDREGRLVACEHGARRVTRTEDDGSITVLADRFEGNPLNSPNDVVVRSDGTIYFTDPPYGIDPNEQEQPVQGVYCLPPDGSGLRLVADDFEGPNGLAFSPDESTLYVADSAPSRCHLRALNVHPDGMLTGSRVFHDMTSDANGVPDGLKVDRVGRIYCTGPGGIWVFDGAATHLGTIVPPEQPANCAWGDADWKSLYITARTSVYRVRVHTAGIPVPRSESHASTAHAPQVYQSGSRS